MKSKKCTCPDPTEVYLTDLQKQLSKVRFSVHNEYLKSLGFKLAYKFPTVWEHKEKGLRIGVDRLTGDLCATLGGFESPNSSLTGLPSLLPSLSIEELKELYYKPQE